MKTWKWLVGGLLLAVLFSVCVHVLAGGSTVPTLFHNDEAWYKDSVAPLLMKDGKYHVPADILTMFSGITVTYHNSEDNLLMTHEDGRYVSLLFGSRSAVVNGEIREQISTFRENGYTYVEAEWIAEIFGLTCNDIRLESGQYVLRLADQDTGRTLEELVARYTAETIPASNVGRLQILLTGTTRGFAPRKRSPKGLMLLRSTITMATSICTRLPQAAVTTFCAAPLPPRDLNLSPIIWVCLSTAPFSLTTTESGISIPLTTER